MAIETLDRRVDTRPEVISSFTFHRFNPHADSVFSIKDKLLEIERRHYPQRAYIDRRLLRDFDDPLTTAILLGDPNRFLIGYAYARRDVFEYSAEVQEIAIDTGLNETGGVEKLMAKLEEALLEEQVKTMSGEFTLQNGYADRVSRLFAGKIVESADNGQARFLRINLVGNIVNFPARRL